MALACLAIAFESAAADLPPRMWKAERMGVAGKTAIYLLGITHTGSTAEQDTYFRERVVPAYMTADVLELESAQLTAENVGSCATPLEGEEAQAVMEDLRNLARFGSEQRLLKTFQLVPQLRNLSNPEAAARENAGADAAALSEYGLVLTIKLNAEFLRSAPVDDTLDAKSPHATFRPAVAILRGLRPNLPEISLDTSADIVNAYCDAGKSRLTILKTFIEQSDVRHPYGMALAKPEQVDEEVSRMMSRLLTRGPIEVDPMDKAFVCGRNPVWTERLSRLQDGRTYFVAVGAAHLANLTVDESPGCASLQRQLEAKGFKVEVVGY